MSISEVITKRLKSDNKRFFACDNVSNYVSEQEKNELIIELTEKFDSVMRSMLIDVENDPNSKDTPRRLAKMYINEIFEGRFNSIPETTSFPNTGVDRYDGMLLVRANIRSVCSHHWQNVEGVAYIGIIPNERVIGLSKYIRLSNWLARRGTLQEMLAVEIRKLISEVTETNDVAVLIEAQHGCVSCRGVRQDNSLTQTISLSGAFKKKKTREEFYDNIKLNKMSNG